jgi:hypothetical protein
MIWLENQFRKPSGFYKGTFPANMFSAAAPRFPDVFASANDGG